MAARIEITGSQELRKFAAQLSQVPTVMRRQLQTRMRGAAEPMKAAVQRSALAIPARGPGTGLRREIAAATRVRVTTTPTDVIVRIYIDPNAMPPGKEALPSLMEGPGWTTPSMGEGARSSEVTATSNQRLPSPCQLCAQLSTQLPTTLSAPSDRSPMPYLNREDILKAEDVQTRDVDVPEWGGVVRVRGLSGADRDLYQASMMTRMPNGDMVPEFTNLTAKLVARAIIDEDGEPLFNELDIGRLGQKSAAALARVNAVAAELSGITETAKAEAEGNSDAAQSGDSTSS